MSYRLSGSDKMRQGLITDQSYGKKAAITKINTQP